ncbi:YceD family protein [Longirhabdus pacifica]|uniref:YceD family protein n=1 Tax=Longirhabdus pacifica TaxID=2305227 RepID=UPI001008FEF1|nr:YceD family protein [Longirhabdus pacifica]
MSTLRINVKELAVRNKPLEINKQLNVQHLVDEMPEIVSATPLELHLTAEYNRGMVQVSGQCQITVTFICARTLVHFNENLHYTFHQMFTTSQAQTMKDEDIEWIEFDTFDLVPYIEEQLILQFPLVPICKNPKEEDEALLKTYSVEELEDTDVQQVKIDPRLEKLKRFFDE